MNRRESQILLHEDPELFRVAINFTAQRTAFQTRLIEKDYFCSVLLQYLASASGSLVFKGGTCLTKVHVEFYRLSEDLDFTISMPVNATRNERREQAVALKAAIAGLPRKILPFRVEQTLTGANNSTQYIAVIGYTSVLNGRPNSVKVEIGLREPLLLPVLHGEAHTILLSPGSGESLVEPFTLCCISRMEAFAEKFRAALSRREVAIRDFYDLDYASRKLKLRPNDEELVGLVRQKLAVPGNEPLSVSEERLADLRQQLEPQLKPVLRENDFREFDLDRAFQMVSDMAAKMV